MFYDEAPSNVLWTRPTWRESNFHVILPLIFSVTSRGGRLRSTLYLTPLTVVGVHGGISLCYIDMFMDHAGEPRRPYHQVPLTDAEHHLRMLLLPDINGISDAVNSLFFWETNTSEACFSILPGMTNRS